MLGSRNKVHEITILLKGVGTRQIVAVGYADTWRRKPGSSGSSRKGGGGILLVYFETGCVSRSARRGSFGAVHKAQRIGFQNALDLRPRMQCPGPGRVELHVRLPVLQS